MKLPGELDAGNIEVIRSALFFCLLVIRQAHAFLREIDPNSDAKLAPDEGLLLVSVDTLSPLKYVRV